MTTARLPVNAVANVLREMRWSCRHNDNTGAVATWSAKRLLPGGEFVIARRAQTPEQGLSVARRFARQSGACRIACGGTARGSACYMIQSLPHLRHLTLSQDDSASRRPRAGSAEPVASTVNAPYAWQCGQVARSLRLSASRRLRK